MGGFMAIMVMNKTKENTQELSVAERVEKALEDIHNKDKIINSFIYLNPKALQQARIVDDKIRKKKAGKLAGLLLAVKSNICVKGLLTTCGSKTLSNYYSPFDADVVRALRSEDAVIIGMTNMDEFAAGSSGETSAYGVTRNPKNIELIPGGSSSGSAAAVAAEFVDAALGTDTGGSIRNPASHCGVVGVKPSYGLVSRFGLIDLAMSLDVIGPISRDVYTSALVLEVIAGHSPFDATSYKREIQSYSNIVKNTTVRDVKSLRIGIIKEFEQLCNERVWKLVVKNIEDFAKATNSSIVELSLKHLNLGVQTYYPIVYTEFYSATRRFDGRKYGFKIEKVAGKEVLRRILGGKHITKSEFKGLYYRKALSVKKAISNELTQAFKKVDIIASPTVPKLPHKIGAKLSVEDMYNYDALTIPASLAGIPAVSIPIATLDKTPIGLQLMTKRFLEAELFKVSKAVEDYKKLR